MNPPLKAKLRHIVDYYGVTRGVGHTRVLFHGVGDEPVILMFGNQKMAADLAPREKQDVIALGWGNLWDQLYGRRLPLVLDNSAVVAILSECLAEIVYLEGIIADREEELMKR